MSQIPRIAASGRPRSKKMRAAYDFGADAIYAGQPRYSLRARNNEFRWSKSPGHHRGARARQKFFVTSNLLPHNDKVRTYHARHRASH